MFTFHFELQKVYLNPDGTEKQCRKVWNLAAELDGNLQLKKKLQTSCYGARCRASV